VNTGSASTTIEYDALRESLTSAGAVLALPELHGGISGALCAGGPTAAERWLDECCADEDLTRRPSAIHDSLHRLMLASWRLLADADMTFEPLLPDDDAPLEEQVQALALWCHGFLGGLGFGAPDAGRRPARQRRSSAAETPAAIEEIVADFAEISRAGVSEEDAADRYQADFALNELKEYVRVSAQIVFEELADRRIAAAAARDIH
jgi:uncharacterized protein YgfB (UPF0149 family)